jgi:hypothetical protein
MRDIDIWHVIVLFSFRTTFFPATLSRVMCNSIVGALGGHQIRIYALPHSFHHTTSAGLLYFYHHARHVETHICVSSCLLALHEARKGLCTCIRSWGLFRSRSQDMYASFFITRFWSFLSFYVGLMSSSSSLLLRYENSSKFVKRNKSSSASFLLPL